MGLVALEGKKLVDQRYTLPHFLRRQRGPPNTAGSLGRTKIDQCLGHVGAAEDATCIKPSNKCNYKGFQMHQLREMDANIFLNMPQLRMRVRLPHLLSMTPMLVDTSIMTSGIGSGESGLAPPPLRFCWKGSWNRFGLRRGFLEMCCAAGGRGNSDAFAQV